MSSAMCSVLMYCGPRRGGPSLYSMIHREGRPPRGPQCFGAHVLRSARRRTLPKQYDSPGGTTSVSSAMYSVLMYCGPRGGGPYPVQYDSPGGTTSVSSAMYSVLMYCGPRRGGPSLCSMIRREGRPPCRPQCVWGSCTAVRTEADPPLYTAAGSPTTVVDCPQKSRTLSDAAFL